MLPDKTMLDKGNFTEYFTKLHDIINEKVTLSPENEGRTLSETSMNDLKVEVGS